MDMIIFSGQSNMQGQTGVMPKPNEPVEGAWEYRWRTDELLPLRHPAGETIEPYLLAPHEGFGSLIPDFCRAYRALTGHEVLAVPAAKGATCVDEWLPDTIRYSVMLNKILAAEKYVSGIEHIYFVWLQGESDALKFVPRETYLERLIQLKNALKKDARIEKFGIIRVGYFAEVCSLPGDDEAIIQAQEDAVRQDDDFVMLTRVTGELSRSSAYISSRFSGHFNNEAQKIIGTLAGEALARIALTKKETNS